MTTGQTPEQLLAEFAGMVGEEVAGDRVYGNSWIARVANMRINVSLNQRTATQAFNNLLAIGALRDTRPRAIKKVSLKTWCKFPENTKAVADCLGILPKPETFDGMVDLAFTRITLVERMAALRYGLSKP
jgi:hypothetical protein